MRKNQRDLAARRDQDCAAGWPCFARFFPSGFSRSQHGFSFIEMALVVLAFGLLFVAGTKMYRIWEHAHQSYETSVTLAQAQEALETYAAKYNRYPCPAIMTEPLDTVDFGKEAGASGGINCDAVDEAVLPRPDGRGARKVRIGTLPVRTLELDDLGMVDAWNHRITYAVTENYTLPGNAVMNANEGAIGLTDSNGNDVTKQDANAVYTLIAAGADGRGAYDLQGNLVADCPDEATLAGQNCNFLDANFRATMLRSEAQDGGAFTNAVTFKSNGMATGWWAGDWSACTCAHETQTRAVQCRDATGAPAIGQCDPATEPDPTRPCPEEDCGWAQSGFGLCSAPCGTGTQTQTVRCVRDDNSNGTPEILPGDTDVGSDAFCPVPPNPVKPASVQNCNTHACPINAACGTAHGAGPYADFAAIPAAQRCSSGTANDAAIADTASTIEWRCDGTGGGTNANCSAQKQEVYTGTGCNSCPFGSYTVNDSPNYLMEFCRVPYGYRGKTPTHTSALTTPSGAIYTNWWNTPMTNFLWVYRKSGESPDTGVQCHYRILHALPPNVSCSPGGCYQNAQWRIETAAPTVHTWRDNNYAHPDLWNPPGGQHMFMPLQSTSWYVFNTGSLGNRNRILNRPCAAEDVGKYAMGTRGDVASNIVPGNNRFYVRCQ